MAWGATDATWRITVPAEGPLQLDLEWRFTALRPGWLDAPLVGAGLVVQEVTGPAVPTPEGLRVVLGPDGATAVVRVRGTLDPHRAGAASLAVLPAGREQVVVDAPGLDVRVAGATDGWLAAADTLSLSWAPRMDASVSRPPANPLVRAEASTAVWGEPGALLTRSVVRWRVLRGELARFELDVSGLEEVGVDGPNLAGTRREGSRLVLEPRSPVRGVFAVTVTARAPMAGESSVAVPAPRPLGADPVARYWTLGRSDEAELVPEGGSGAARNRSVAARALPDWARGLSDSTPIAYWHGDAALRLRSARFTPMRGPDTVIERAAQVVATSIEGRMLVRSTWDVRNERSQYLHVSPAPGFRPMTARVSGEPVSVLSDGAGGLYVPLEKSVESVQGLLTFPVELTWIAEEEAWGRRGERTLRLPAVDAPIQSLSWEVFLPRGRTASGGQEAVSVRAPIGEGEEELLAAISAYKDNNFTDAQRWLDHARASGSASDNVGRLQSNLNVLLESDTPATSDPNAAEAAAETPAENMVSRRVRDLANAKTVTMQVAQDNAEESARKAVASGDVDEAEKHLEQVVIYAENIGVTEQRESSEQSAKKRRAQALLRDVKEAQARRDARPDAPPGGAAAGPSPSTGSTASARSEDRTLSPSPAASLPELPAREALQVKAAPLTLALPLGGEVVRAAAALLPADAPPTLTLADRTPPGAPR